MDRLEKLKQSDPAVAELVLKELDRQRDGLEMIPSENYVSLPVLEAMGTIFTNKYSEGQPFKRYYGGNEWVDEVEQLAVDRVKKLFGVEHVNVQPYSGSPANLAVYMATCRPGDVVMGQGLSDGGHLTHGFEKSATGTFFKGIAYHVGPDGYLDMDEFARLAREHRPRLIWCGISSYPRKVPFQEFAKIADEIGAYLVADIAHIAGLVVAGEHESPVPHVHIVTTTLHKTLRGPRAGMIMVTKKGLQKDPDLAKKIDSAVFPGLQGGPHDHTTAALAVSIGEALKPEFKEYGRQVVANSKALASRLMERGIKTVTNGTDNHLVLVDLTGIGKGMGIFAEKALDLAGITVNKNTIPREPSSPFYPSGVRIGTPAVTSRGMKEREMRIIADWIVDVLHAAKSFKLPENRDERKKYVEECVEILKIDPTVLGVREKVRELCKRFPLYEGM